MDELKGRNTKLESDNQELKQMTVKVCFSLFNKDQIIHIRIYFIIS